MELLDDLPGCQLDDDDWKIYGRNPNKPPHYVSSTAVLKNSYITEGCEIEGRVEHSVIFPGAVVEEGAVVEDSVVFPDVRIKKGATVYKSVIGANAVIGEGARIGCNEDDAVTTFVNTRIFSDNITLVGPELEIGARVKVALCSMVTKNMPAQPEAKGGKNDEK